MEKRVAILGIFIISRENSAKIVNEIIGQFSDIIIGRMGIPYNNRDMSVISVIIDGTNNQIGALSGKLGNIPGVSAKVIVAK